MKMNTSRLRDVVDEPNNWSPSDSCPDKGARYLTIIPLQVCYPEVGINLSGKIINGDLVEVKHLPGSFICVGSQW